MILEKLEARRLPGIRDLGPLEFVPGVNLVVGPNASGKSSIVRAWRWLWRRAAKPHELAQVMVHARLLDAQGRVYNVRCDYGGLRWRPEPPWWPDPEDSEGLGAYLLCMEDLATADAPPQRFLTEVRRLLGGVAVDPYGLLATTKPPGRRPHELHEWQQRKAELEKERQRQAGLARQYEMLPKWRRELAEEEAVRTRLATTEQALRAVGERDALRSLEAKLQELLVRYPGLDGVELDAETFERMCAEREQCLEQRRELAGELKRLEAEQRNLGLASLPEPAAVERWLDGARDLVELAREVEAARAKELRLASRLAEDRCRLGEVAAGSSSPVDAEVLVELERAIGDYAEAWGQARAVAGLRPWLETQLPTRGEVEPAHLETGAAVLRAWLAGVARAPAIAMFAAVGAVVAALLWFVGEQLVGPLAGPLAGGLAVVTGLLGGGSWWLTRTAAARARRAYEATGLHPPDAWTAGEVGRRLVDLERIRVVTELRIQLEGLMPEGRRARLAERLGALGVELRGEPPAPAWLIPDRLRVVHELRAAERELAEVRAHLEGQSRRLEARLGELREAVASWCALPDGCTPRELVAELERLQKRTHEHRELELQRQHLLQEQARLTERLAELEARISAVAEQFGLPAHAHAEMARRLAQLPAYRDLVGQCETLRRRFEAFLDAIGDAELRAWAEAGERARLDALQRTLEERLEQLQALQQRVAKLEAEVEATSRDRRYEVLAAELERRRAELRDRYRTWFRQWARRFWLRRLLAQHEQDFLPSLFQRADELFWQFTRKRYRLELGASGGELVAVDKTASDDEVKERRLEELSTGTRMQLLLALRLAWIGELEQGREPLPLFLDEVLTTTDEERFAAIVAALEEIARERQVVYLTAREHDVALWERVAGRAPHRVQLGPRPNPELRLPTTPPGPPSPEGHDPASYAQALGVHPLDPRRWREDHLFHLLWRDEELPLLHRLLELGIDRIGKLESFLPRAEFYGLEAAQRELLDRRWRAFREWVQAWQRGRSWIEASEIVETGIFSEKMAPRVLEVAAEVDWDPRELVARLRAGAVRRLRESYIEEFKERLQERGYWPEEEPLDRLGRQDAVVAAMGAEVPAHLLVEWVAAWEGWLPERESEAAD